MSTESDNIRFANYGEYCENIQSRYNKIKELYNERGEISQEDAVWLLNEFRLPDWTDMMPDH